MTRSSLAKEGLIVLGGVIDSGYRGEVKVIIYAPSLDSDFDMADILESYTRTGGNAIAQLAILPVPEFDIVEASHLSVSERGSNGFGSTNGNGARS